MVFLFLMFVFLAPLVGGRYSYVVIFLFAIYAFFYLLIKGFDFNLRRLGLTQLLLFLLPLMVFFSWVYGFLLGINNGVPFEYVTANFAGLALYLLFYIFYFIIDVDIACKALFSAAFLVSIFAVGLVLSADYSAVGSSASSIGDYRVLYFSGFVYVVPFILMYITLFFFGGRRMVGAESLPFISKGFAGFLIFLVFSFALLVPAMSKGLFLIYFICLMLCLMSYSLYAVQNLRINVVFIFFVLVLFLLLGLVLLFTNIIDVLLYSFSSRESSNSIRSEQLHYLVDEWSLIGSGLGSSLVSGYSRDDTGYGFELTYINLVNKLGLFAVPLFLSYLAPVVFGMINIFTKNKRILGCWVLGLMSYLIIGAGNPVLLAPEFVMLHLIALITMIHDLKCGAPKGVYLKHCIGECDD